MKNCETFWSLIEPLTCGKKEIIDEYQRNYVWNEQQAIVLVNSIENANGNLFIGNIITYEKERERFQLVDGQQRLTTFLIILKALRDSEPENSDFRKSCNDFFVNRHGEWPYIYKKQDPPKSFDCLINNNDIECNKDSNICKVYKALLNHFSDMSEDRKILIYEKIRDNVQVGHLVCESQQEAYNTFASINGLSVRVEEKYSVMCLIFEELSKNNNSGSETLQHDLHEIIEGSDASFLCRFYYSETGEWCKRHHMVASFNKFLMNKNASVVATKIKDFKEKDSATISYLKKHGFLTTNATVHVFVNDVLITYGDRFTDKEKYAIIKAFNAIAVRMIVTNARCHLIEDIVSGVVVEIVNTDDKIGALKKALNLSDVA